MHPLGALVHHLMGAQPLVEPPVRTLDQQIVVGLAQHRAEAIGVVEVPGAAGVGGVQPIGDGRRQPLGQALEHPVLMALLERGDQAALGVSGLERGGMGREGADRQPLFDDVRTQHGERVPVARLGDGGDLVPPETPAGGSAWLQVFSTGTFQMSSAYSRIARSDENHPTWATLSMAERRHAFLSRNLSPTSRCFLA